MKGLGASAGGEYRPPLGAARKEIGFDTISIKRLSQGVYRDFDIYGDIEVKADENAVLVRCPSTDRYGSC